MYYYIMYYQLEDHHALTQAFNNLGGPILTLAMQWVMSLRSRFTFKDSARLWTIYISR